MMTIALPVAAKECTWPSGRGFSGPERDRKNLFDFDWAASLLRTKPDYKSLMAEVGEDMEAFRWFIKALPPERPSVLRHPRDPEKELASDPKYVALLKDRPDRKSIERGFDATIIYRFWYHSIYAIPAASFKESHWSRRPTRKYHASWTWWLAQNIWPQPCPPVAEMKGIKRCKYLPDRSFPDWRTDAEKACDAAEFKRWQKRFRKRPPAAPDVIILRGN